MTKHPPLSTALEQLLASESQQEGFTINDLLERTEGRGIYLVMILLCLPFITPIPLPGLSTLVGIIVVVLAVRLALGLPPHLPKFLGARRLPVRRQEQVLRASLKTLRFIEKVAKPRGREWIRLPVARLWNALVVALMGALLVVPFPPLVLFTNSLPSYGVILIAASLMEEDGLLVWFGYAAALLTVVYFALLGFGGVALFNHIFERATQ
jgi:hypothetical protein